MADVCNVGPIESEPLGKPLVESYLVALRHLSCRAPKERIASGDE